VGLVYDSRELTGVTITKPGVTGVLQMVSEPTLAVFTGAYRSVEKDTVAYGSRTWYVRMTRGPLKGTWYDMYAANWIYSTCMPVLDVCT
jgi:hypothetical protein